MNKWFFVMALVTSVALSSCGLTSISQKEARSQLEQVVEMESASSSVLHSALAKQLIIDTVEVSDTQVEGSFRLPAITAVISLAKKDTIGFQKGMETADNRLSFANRYFSALMKTEIPMEEYLYTGSVTEGVVQVTTFQETIDSSLVLLKTFVEGYGETEPKEDVVPEVSVGQSFIVTGKNSRFVITIDRLIDQATTADLVKLSPANANTTVGGGAKVVLLEYTVKRIGKGKIFTPEFCGVSRDARVLHSENGEIFGTTTKTKVKDEASCIACVLTELDGDVYWCGQASKEVYKVIVAS